MNKKSIAILLVASSFTGSAFATSMIDKLITKHSSATPSIVKTHKTTHQANRSYTDFSGTWLIDCGDTPASMSTVIENDADHITLDGVESRIGQGLQGMAESNEEYARYEHGSFEWNENRSALIMKSVAISKDNTDNSPIQTDMDTITFTMKNGQINLDGKFVMLEDMEPVNPTTVHCVLTKKQ